MARPNKGPRLVLNEANLYEIRWSEDGRSKRVSTRTGDIQEAQRFLAGWILEAETEKKAASTFTIRRIVQDYMDEHVEEQVIDKRRISDCCRPIVADLGDLMPCDLTSDRMKTYKKRRAAGLLGRKVQDSTIRRELVALVAALNHAVKQRRIDGREVPHISMPPNAPSRDFWLDEREEKAFLELAAKTSGARPSRVHLFVAIALDTAARRKSIETLRWSQVDLLAGVINYANDGKRQKNKRRVPVPISNRLRPLLEAAYEARESEWVLYTPYSMQKAFDALQAKAVQTIGDKFAMMTIHDMRHTWATLAARAGVDLYQIAGVLGDTLATVERNYLHHCPDHLRAAVNFR